MKSLLLKRLRTKNNYLQDWIPARILRFVIGNETAGGEKEEEKNKNTSAFHLKKRKYFLCWAQNYFKGEKKSSPGIYMVTSFPIHMKHSDFFTENI